MKIISDFKDYYDSLQSSGTDESLIYKRRSSELQTEASPEYCSLHAALDPPWLYVSGKLNKNESTEVWPLLIGFCGSVYQAYSFEYYDSTLANAKFLKRICCFDKGSCIKEYSMLSGANPNLQTELRDLEISLAKFFSHTSKTRNLSAIFHEFNVPLFVIYMPLRQHRLHHKDWKSIKWKNAAPEKIDLILNPCLKDFQFNKIKDEYSCYQEIAQYISGVLSNTENPADNSSDLDKLKKHGFDRKYGFRKRKS